MFCSSVFDADEYDVHLFDPFSIGEVNEEHRQLMEEISKRKLQLREMDETLPKKNGFVFCFCCVIFQFGKTLFSHVKFHTKLQLK